MRVAAAQPRNRTIDFRLEPPEVLAGSIGRSRSWSSSSTRPGRPAATRWRCPEDTLGLLKWEAANPEALGEVLPEAVSRMLDRLGKAAADHRMYLVLCNDAIETDGRDVQHRRSCSAATARRSAVTTRSTCR